MKFILKQNILIDVLQKLQGPTSFRQNFPVLNCILVEAFDNKIRFTSTDLDITITSTIDGTVTKPGKAAVPAKHFIPIIRELPSQDISLELLKNNLLVKCGKIEFKINTMDPDEFPQTEEEKKKTLIKLDPQDLVDMIRLTSFCVGFEDTNYVLNGILFELQNDTISLAATDGKRLSWIKRKLPSSQSEIHSKIEFIFPIKSVNELFKLIKESKEEIYMYREKNNIGFDLKNTVFISKPIEGEFPRYENFIPAATNNKLELPRKDFLAALKRAELLSAPDYQGIKLELKKEELSISKSTPQLGEIKEVLSARYSGPHLNIGFNPTYLIDVLKNIEEENIGFEIYDADKPAVLRLKDYVYLVLPMKLS